MKIPVSQKPSRRMLLWSIALVLGLGAAAVLFFSTRTKEPNAIAGATDTRASYSGDKPPIPVRAQSATQEDFPVYLSGLGTVTPFRTVTVKPRVDGELIRVAFAEGQMVERNALLAEIDPRPYSASLIQAKGQLAHDEALLRNAEIDLARYKTLLTQDSIASQQVATQEALVQQYRGTVEADRGQVEFAELQLAYTRITSPLTGRAGLRLVDPGNIVQAANNTGIVVVTQLQPIAVVFTLPEDTLATILEQTRAGRVIPLEAYDRAGAVRLAQGRLAAIDNQIDATTGTVKLKGEFANTDQSLFPNQFVNIKLVVKQLPATAVVPAAAIQYGATGAYVFVVNADRSVNVRAIKLGPIEGEKAAIVDGIKPGERVVTDGIDALRDGAKVEIVGEPQSVSEASPSLDKSKASAH